jgi:hypothetical protein
MRVDEAEMIHQEIAKQSGNPIGVLAKLLPVVSSVYDARRMLNSIIGDSQSKTLYLRKLLGPAYRPIIGIFDGYYCLDLKKENDRVCLSKLFEQNNTTTSRRKASMLWDVSQDGNWSSFRNEAYSGSNASICVENFTPIPKYGHLEFDFSGSNRPRPNYDLPISNRKFMSILSEKLCILPVERIASANEFLQELSFAERKSLAGQGYVYWQADFARAKFVSHRVNELYNQLVDRKEQLQKAQRREFIAVDIGSTVPDAASVENPEEDGLIEKELQVEYDHEPSQFKWIPNPNPQDHEPSLDGGGSLESLQRSVDTMGDPIIRPEVKVAVVPKSDFIRGDEEVF